MLCSTSRLVFDAVGRLLNIITSTAGAVPSVGAACAARLLMRSHVAQDAICALHDQQAVPRHSWQAVRLMDATKPHTGCKQLLQGLQQGCVAVLVMQAASQSSVSKGAP